VVADLGAVERPLELEWLESAGARLQETWPAGGTLRDLRRGPMIEVGRWVRACSGIMQEPVENLAGVDVRLGGGPVQADAV
jgi:hypothetical protein